MARFTCEEFGVDTEIRIGKPMEYAFSDARESAVYSLHGLLRENGRYVRLPRQIADTVSPRVAELNMECAGGRVRFRTDSAKIAIHLHYGSFSPSPHFPNTGKLGCDLYARENGDEIYKGTFVPTVCEEGFYEAAIDLGSTEMRDLTLNLPPYGRCEYCLIGTDPYAVFEEPRKYAYPVPVVFYGSSITQGGCCSHPGSLYQNILSRRLDFDYVNLGFSGAARGEDAMMHYIAGLKMAAFVYDYDHNAPTAEHLLSTHEKGYLTVRKANPDLPILLLSRPKAHYDDDDKRRLEIIRRTFENGLAHGDRNLYFIPGNELITGQFSEIALVDNVHPNDAGFLSIANAIEPVLAKMLK